MDDALKPLLLAAWTAVRPRLPGRPARALPPPRPPPPIHAHPPPARLVPGRPRLRHAPRRPDPRPPTPRRLPHRRPPPTVPPPRPAPPAGLAASPAGLVPPP